MNQKDIWTMLYRAGVCNGVQNAVQQGQYVNQYLEDAMRVVRPFVTGFFGNIDRKKYDDAIWYVTSYLMASNEEIYGVING